MITIIDEVFVSGLRNFSVTVIGGTDLLDTFDAVK
jgi:hypothetical protein